MWFVIAMTITETLFLLHLLPQHVQQKCFPSSI